MTDFYLGIFIGMVSCGMFALILCLCDAADREYQNEKCKNLKFENPVGQDHNNVNQRYQNLHNIMADIKSKHIVQGYTPGNELKLKCTTCGEIIALTSENSLFKTPAGCKKCKDPFQGWRIV